ncbi:TRAP transporter small permease [Mesobaculum littorinae]|uniref:TRAP transporter small permease protein n=1 Tax=Mesobaculum littorinae TaxID=2486419 RepID=A0A438AME0_9RHOB|nr:TRAP transporter small permease [Mesobaculum littorinae]RVV99814.1 TRAP transporter small permease [Mesobaculum littorinae]
MNALKRLLDLTVTGLAWIAGIATALMMLHVTLDVFMRTVFSSPLTGTVEIVSAYHMAALAFLPLALITRERGHIIVELFTTWMKWRPRTFLDATVAIVTVIYTAVFTWKAIEIAIDKTHIREAKEAGVGFVEIWPSRWVVALGFGLMTIYVAINLVQDYRNAARNTPPPDDGGGIDIPETEEQL